MMNVAVECRGDAYQLSAAVLIYTNQAKGHAFATKHEVLTEAGSAVVRPGSPLTTADYAALVRALAPKEQPKMIWRDSRVLASGLGRLLWWAPAQKRPMFFQKSSTGRGTVEGRGVCPSPALVFMANVEAAELYVWAIKADQAPQLETQLYQAPFFNVWSTGQVCCGNAVKPAEDQQGDPGAWERMFFGSNFTHPNFSEKNRLLKGDPNGFWARQLAKPSATFPQQVLVPLSLRVGDLLEVDVFNKLRALPRAQGEF